MDFDSNSKIQIADIVIDFSKAQAYSLESFRHQNAQTPAVELDDKSLLLFQLLLSAEDQKVCREELLTKIWEGRIVSDDSLTNLVSQTRSRIKQISSANIIRTMPKKGYALQGEIQSLTSPIQDSPVQHENSKRRTIPFSILVGILICVVGLFWYQSQTPDHYDQTIAVLPVETLSSDSEILNSSLSFTEELTHQLANYPALRVVSKTISATVNKEALGPEQISQALNSRFFIEGSIRQSEGAIRLTLQLIDGQSGLHVFSQIVDTSVDEFKSNREDIIQMLSRLIVNEIPFSIEAVSEQEEAIYIARCDSYLDVAALYEKYILLNIETIAPQAEPACVALSQISANPSLLSKPAEWYLFMAKASVKDRSQRLAYLELGRKYVEQGLARASDDEALLSQNLNLWNYQLWDALRYDSDPEEAFKQVQAIGEKARKIYPDNSTFTNNYAVALRRYGVAVARKGQSPVPHFERAIILLEESITLFPQNANLQHSLGRLYKFYASYLLSIGQEHLPMLQKSIEHYEQAIALEPDQYNVYNNIGNAYQSLTKWLASQYEPYEEALANTRRYYAKALEHAEKKQQVYNNLAALNSTLSKIELSRGNSAMRLTEQGIEYAQQALLSQPDYIWPHFNLMNMFYYQHFEEFATGGNAISAGQQCVAIASKGHELKSNLASTWHTMSLCAQITVRMYLEYNRKEAAISMLNEIDGWIAHSIELNAKAADGYKIRATNQMLKARAGLKFDNALEATLQPIEQALSLRPDEIEVLISALEVVTYYRHASSDKLTAIREQLVELIENNDAQHVAYQLLTLLLTHSNMSSEQWQVEVNKQQAQHGLLASYYGRQYQNLLNN
ncbi:winged helix-turn-helix domain-containing protein [Alteromonas lipolytica]|uniref:OmpR/PhoB-type domain-containing protein n=1 Tax=Alteromonas lipolytica TaxID=1856405 RepID=A0A1E8FBK8_9ALTE|nr:winged helix-turn-helix domain-containing protein [Alteromonas lipolytica]OFI33312.1 hypothetical protein BFC17_03360 [Alteromonas lipolytica]GGF60769.1 hypothetical protein GCM10011338_11300 [Alteromonas lipolytica]